MTTITLSSSCDSPGIAIMPGIFLPRIHADKKSQSNLREETMKQIGSETWKAADRVTLLRLLSIIAATEHHCGY
jgi:hypothetical protein